MPRRRRPRPSLRLRRRRRRRRWPTESVIGDGNLPGRHRRRRRQRPSAADRRSVKALNVTRRSLLIGASGAAVSTGRREDLQAQYERPCRGHRRRRVRRLDRASSAGEQGHEVTLIDALGTSAQPRLLGRRIPADARRLRQGRDLHPDGARLPAAMEGAERDLGPADLHSVRHPVLLPDRGSLRPRQHRRAQGVRPADRSH